VNITILQVVKAETATKWVHVLRGNGVTNRHLQGSPLSAAPSPTTWTRRCGGTPRCMKRGALLAAQRMVHAARRSTIRSRRIRRWVHLRRARTWQQSRPTSRSVSWQYCCGHVDGAAYHARIHTRRAHCRAHGNQHTLNGRAPPPQRSRRPAMACPPAPAAAGGTPSAPRGL
jgi:hypothetical protein